ncbi:MAG TPA: glycosyltransferase family 25 protein [Thermoanaerobaculia bacterium]|nr:glycosyltransferase family 25 protein [Thermoanaerobaculia bacterium]
MTNIRIAYINLSSRTERHDAFLRNNRAELDASGLPWHRVEGVDGRELASSTTTDALTARGIIAREGLSAGYEPHTWGHLGCALAHRSVWEEAARGNDDDVLVILEDDGQVGPRFGTRLRRALELATRRAPWDVVHLGFNPDVVLRIRLDCPRMDLRLACEVDGRPVAVGEPFPVSWPDAASDDELLIARVLDLRGLCGYAVTARGARRLLEVCFPLTATSIDGTINRKLQEGLLTTLIALPPLVMSANDHSISDTAPSPSSRYNEFIPPVAR